MIITAIVCILFDWPCLVWRWWYAEMQFLGLLQHCTGAASVVLVVGSVLGVYVLFTHWLGGSVWLVFCMPAHPLVYVFSWSFFDTGSYYISIDVDGCSVESLLQRDRWQCIYRTLGKLKSWRVAWIVKEPHTEIQKLPPYYIIHWLGKASKEKGHINICKAGHKRPAMIVSTEKVRDDWAELWRGQATAAPLAVAVPGAQGLEAPATAAEPCCAGVTCSNGSVLSEQNSEIRKRSKQQQLVL